MSFISDYLKHTEKYESPGSFWLWSGFTAISAVLRDSVFRRQGDITTYPNIYVLFLAPSGVYRKGLPVNLCQSLVNAISNTKIISGRTSIQAIIDELGHTETTEKGHLVRSGAALFLASELAAGLVSDPASIGILTDIYDLKTDYKHHLRSTGRRKIEKIVFSMLAASNETLLREVYDARAMQGGLLARTFLIKPDQFRPANPLLDSIDNKDSYNNLVKLLKDISNLKGEMAVSEDAAKEYQKWYIDFRESYRNKEDKSGISGRIHMSAFKLSMILAANDLSTVITKHNMEESINLCISLLPNYHYFVMGSGKSNISEAGAIFLRSLTEARGYKISRKDFLQENWTSVDTEMLDKVTVTLQSAGIVEVAMMSGSTIVYSLTQKGIDMMSAGDKK